ncbi:MAG: hypothetical protein CMJ18_19985, partial [Phycisphaeraceae bacterium]|nr:hypothetical protein [Phycisphaeraceae bacterium]
MDEAPTHRNGISSTTKILSMTRAGTSASLPSGLLPAILLALVAPTIAADRPSAHWPQWRGPLGTGVAPHGDPPVTWDADRNVRWKVEIPGRGHATPVVWHDRVFVTTAVPYGESLEPRFSGAPGAHDNLPVTRHHRFAVLAFSLFNGK